MTLDPASPGRIHIGISGWRYKGWRGVFYPEKLPQRRELEFASRKFGTIELNGSFYSLQRPQSFLRWHAETPPDFTFAIKGSRYITHMLRLRNVEGPLANFFAQGLLHFGAKLGPILWQLPPNFTFEAERLEQFFALLPRTLKQAAELARNHDDRLNDRSWFQVRKDAPLRHALEIRHESFVTEKFIRLLRRYGVGLVVADTVEWPLLMDVTADFRLLPSSRQRTVVRQRLRSRRTRCMGPPCGCVGAGKGSNGWKTCQCSRRGEAKASRCICIFRQRHESPRAVRCRAASHSRQQATRRNGP